MADDFSRSIARVVVAQIAEGTGFDTCQESAVDILADLLLRYLSTVCASSHSFAEQAGRSQANLADTLLSLEELGVTADDLHSHIQLQQGTDVPFAHTLAPYPVHTQRPLPPTFRDQKEDHPAHIPDFLPAFPDPHTYQQTAAYTGHEADAHKQRQSMLEAKQKAEAALNKMHQRMTSKAAQPDSNPFMSPPVVEQLQASAAGSSAAVHQQNGISSAAVGQQQLGPQQPTLQHAPVQQQQQQQQGDLDEDALFEQAIVLKAFSSVLPPELLVKETKTSAEDLQQQQHDGVVEEQPMDIDGAAASNIPPGSQTWLGWKPQAQQQQQQGESISAPADTAAAAAVGADVLDSVMDPSGLAAGKRAALVLVGKHRPADAYAEKGRGTGIGAGGSRQRKSKYDADPRVMQAEGILAAGPEQVFASAGGGVHALFGQEEELE